MAGISLAPKLLTPDWRPADHGYLSWTSDPGQTTGTALMATAGTLYLMRIHVPAACLVTNIVGWISTAGATLTTNQCWAVLYTAAGAKLSQTADQAAAWVSTGVKVMALGAAQQLTAGDYYIGHVFNGTTGPTWTRATPGAAGFANVNLSAPNFRSATADTALTTTAPATFGTQTSFSQGWWSALS
jgi:hypothetical protein